MKTFQTGKFTYYVLFFRSCWILHSKKQSNNFCLFVCFKENHETKDFPDSSVSKESACNAGDSSSIPESGRFTGEGIGFPLQYSWASLGVQLVKSLPAMWETWVWSLGWEDPLEKERATNSCILAWRLPELYSPWCHKDLDMTEWLTFKYVKY